MIKIESTSAATCRTNGIKVGTQLISSTKHGEVSIEITYIGMWEIRAKTLHDDKRGPSISDSAMELQGWRGWMVAA